VHEEVEVRGSSATANRVGAADVGHNSKEEGGGSAEDGGGEGSHGPSMRDCLLEPLRLRFCFLLEIGTVCLLHIRAYIYYTPAQLASLNPPKTFHPDV
jgi:hypothetical protein